MKWRIVGSTRYSLSRANAHRAKRRVRSRFPLRLDLVWILRGGVTWR